MTAIRVGRLGVVILATAGVMAAALSSTEVGAALPGPPSPVARSATPNTGPETPQAAYRLPLAGSPGMLVAFRAPKTVYGAGHRGVDLAAVRGTGVLAAGAAIVRFAGPVAGRGVIVLRHPDGTATEYEPVSSSVRIGQAVAAGQEIGSVSGAHSACAPATCLHWGARRGGAYFDPMLLLRPLGVVRLLGQES